MTIEIIKIEYKHIGALLAVASVRIGEVIVHDWRIVQQPGQVAHVQPPQRTYLDSAGRQRYSGPLVIFPETQFYAIARKILSVIERESEENA